MSATDMNTGNQTGNRDCQTGNRDCQTGNRDCQTGNRDYQTSGPDRQQPGRTADGGRGRSTVAFGARAAILAGLVATGCAGVAPAAANAATAHPAHVMTAVALGATSSGVVTPMNSTCCS
jgi:hypothetical protein